jgi:hypothetical protein
MKLRSGVACVTSFRISLLSHVRLHGYMVHGTGVSLFGQTKLPTFLHTVLMEDLSFLSSCKYMVMDVGITTILLYLGKMRTAQYKSHQEVK